MNVSRHKPHVPDLVPTWAPATGQTDWAHGALWPGKGPAYLQEPLGRHEVLVSLSLAESTLQSPGEKLTERVPPSLDAEHSAPHSEARCLILLVTQTGRRPRSHPRASEGLKEGLWELAVLRCTLYSPCKVPVCAWVTTQLTPL
jgi:hypothetical protein